MEISGVKSEALTEGTAADISCIAGSISRYLGSLAGNGRSVSAWRVLSMLVDSGPRRIGDLAQQQHIAQPTMTSLVHRLEKDGLVLKSYDPADHRAALASITDQGLQEVADYRHRAATTLNKALEGLSAAERTLLSNSVPVLAQVAQNFKDLR